VWGVRVSNPLIAPEPRPHLLVSGTVNVPLPVRGLSRPRGAEPGQGMRELATNVRDSLDANLD
jgi:hypothetical protein